MKYGANWYTKNYEANAWIISQGTLAGTFIKHAPPKCFLSQQILKKLMKLMFIGPCIIAIVDECKTNLMSLAILFHLLCAQHVSDINMSIFRSLRLCWWITTSVVLFSFRCVLELLLRLVFGGARFAGFSLLLSLLVHVQPEISKLFFFPYHEWKRLFTQNCVTNYQTYLENQLNNFWTWNNSMLIKYHTGDSAESIRIIWAQFRGSSAWYSETYCIKTPSGESVFIRSRQ